MSMEGVCTYLGVWHWRQFRRRGIAVEAEGGLGVVSDELHATLQVSRPSGLSAQLKHKGLPYAQDTLTKSLHMACGNGA